MKKEATHFSKQKENKVWHDLCGCVQFFRLGSYFWAEGIPLLKKREREKRKKHCSVKTQIIFILLQHAAPQSWSLWTRVLWATDATENLWCRDEKKCKKKDLKENLHGDTFLIVP